MNKKLFLLTLPLIALGIVRPTWAEDQRAADQRSSMRSDRSDRMEVNDIVRESQNTYRELCMDAKKKIPSNVMENAQCVAIFPKITSMAVGVGGAHGDGMAFCKTANNQWSNPVFLNLNGGSLGAQLGVRNTDLVMFMSGSEARKQLTKGSVTLGGDLSAVLGTYDESVSLPEKGVVAYSKNEGAFAGAALGGVVLSRDSEDEKAFYGMNLSGDPFDAKIPASNLVTTESVRSLLPAI